MIDPGTLIYLKDTNRWLTGTKHEGTVQLYMEGQPGYRTCWVSSIQPVMFLRIEHYVDTEEGRLSRIVVLHNGKVCYKISHQDVYLDDHVKRVLI